MTEKWPPAKCTNPHCPHQRGVLQTLLHRPSPGLLLHKQWLCSPECLHQVLVPFLTPLIESTRASQAAKAHRFPLGLLLHSSGMISKESLHSALAAQRETGEGRVGDWLLRQGAVTEAQITQALARQWSLPVYPLEGWEQPSDCTHLLPFSLLDTFHMLPVHYLPASGLLYVAFSTKVDYTALYAIEQMLEFRTQPCVVQESYLDKVLKTLHQQSHATGIPIAKVLRPSIISSATIQEVQRFGAQEVRVVGCANNIWVRLRAPVIVRDLLFHHANQDLILLDESCLR